MRELCDNCGEREGTVEWGGAEPTFAFTHGFMVKWCEICVATAQLDHAEKCAASIPKLIATLSDHGVTRRAGVVRRDVADRLAEALREIRDHGNTDEFPCYGIGGSDCADLMQERARAVLAESPWKEEER